MSSLKIVEVFFSFALYYTFKCKMNLEFNIGYKIKYLPLVDTETLDRYFILRPLVSGDITRQGVRVTSELIFCYINLQDM